MSGDQKVVRVGSRKSQLAMVQTEKVIDLLSAKVPHTKFEIVSMTTTGDKVLNKPLSKIGEKSLFTKELEVALLDDRVDVVVHSLKDVPTELAPGLAVGAICARDDNRDALVVKKDSKATSLSTLPEGSVVGTSSMRRTAQLGKLYPHLKIIDVRGNLNTRLAKLDEEGGDYDALILATAGLVRLGWSERISQILDSDEMMYAVGQGAIGVECRSDDLDTLHLLSHISDPPTTLTCLAERSFLNKLEGGCSVPVAVLCKLDGKQLSLKGGVYSVDGTQSLEDSVQCTLEELSTQEENGDCTHADAKHITSVVVGGRAWKQQLAAEKLGSVLAEKLTKRGAAEMLKEARLITMEKEMLKNLEVK